MNWCENFKSFGEVCPTEGDVIHVGRRDVMDRRVEHDDEAARMLGLHEAEVFLRTMGIGYKGLKVSSTDLADVWVKAQ